MALNNLDDYFPDWKEREALAEAMIPLIGKLYRKNVICLLLRAGALQSKRAKLMKAHRYVRQVAQNELSEFETFPLLQAIAGLDLGPCHIDGRNYFQYMEDAEASKLSPEDYARQACAKVIGQDAPPVAEPQDVVLYGFGRIGRLLAQLFDRKNRQRRSAKVTRYRRAKSQCR